MLIKKLQIMKAQKGFTLVELIVVVAIIGILAAILIPILIGYIRNSRVAGANSDARNIHGVVAAYIGDMDAYDINLNADEQVPISNNGQAGWNAVTSICPDAPAGGDLQERLNASHPNMRGEGVIYALASAAVAIAWAPFGSDIGDAPHYTDDRVWLGSNWVNGRVGRVSSGVIGLYPEYREP
jgi:prepilin-type N-terminal cleavage/methylation domain-containing protein